MVPGDDDDLPDRTARGHAERVALALDDEHRNLDRIELVLARLLGLARRMLGKREAQHGVAPVCGGGPARDARAERAPTCDQRHRIAKPLAQEAARTGDPRLVAPSPAPAAPCARDP